MILALIVGVALLGAYVAIGIWATRVAWSWSSEIKPRWIRVALASTVAFIFFMPGLVGAGHGVGIGPAWLMFATGTFNALTATSKVKVLLGIAIAWVVAFSIGHLIVGSTAKGRGVGDDNPFR